MPAPLWPPDRHRDGAIHGRRRVERARRRVDASTWPGGETRGPELASGTAGAQIAKSRDTLRRKELFPMTTIGIHSNGNITGTPANVQKDDTITFEKKDNHNPYKSIKIQSQTPGVADTALFGGNSRKYSIGDHTVAYNGAATFKVWGSKNAADDNDDEQEASQGATDGSINTTTKPLPE
jgi:hypothetical protein